MPPDLRLCFSYCALFPKGHNMAKDELIYQWTALGFVKSSGEVATWQQHGENCIHQLLEMSFFQCSKSPSIGRYGKDVQFFTMHDLVHDLTRLIMEDELLDAGAKCNNINGKNCRYACLADCNKPLSSFVICPDKIRALRFLGSGQTGHCNAGFSAAKYLRILDLEECSLKKLPSSIGQLKLLRYLNAPGLKDKAIPSCVTKLSKLIFLSLRGSSRISELPHSIGEMESLMYLDLSECRSIIRLPRSLGKLESLVHLDLSGCSSTRGIPEALCSLTKLQYLNLSYHYRGWEEPAPESLSQVIGKLSELRYLNLSGCMIEDHFYDIFDSINTLSNLEHLDLSNNRISCLRKLHTLDLTGCGFLVRSTLPMNKSLISLPNFVVHADEGEQSSNLIMLKDVNPLELKISNLEMVKSIEEAPRIDLSEKQNMVKLTLDWTSGTKGSVEDMELLRELRPPSSLRRFNLQGYNSVSFPPAWLVSADIYLPNLVIVDLKDLSQCTSLPPLGQLPNLEQLYLKHMPSLTKIDRGFCGQGMKAFSKLETLVLYDMKNLDEWITTYSYGEGVTEDEFMFPNLLLLHIGGCRKLRVVPCPPRVKHCWVVQGDSEGVLVQWGESAAHTGGSSTASALVQELRVQSCPTPVHQWKLLHHLPGLDQLTISGCRDLRSSPEITQALISLRSLCLWDVLEPPQWLGNLTSLRSLSMLLGNQAIEPVLEQLVDCVSLKRLDIDGVCFPESILQPTNLSRLEKFHELEKCYSEIFG